MKLAADDRKIFKRETYFTLIAASLQVTGLLMPSLCLSWCLHINNTSYEAKFVSRAYTCSALPSGSTALLLCPSVLASLLAWSGSGVFKFSVLLRRQIKLTRPKVIMNLNWYLIIRQICDGVWALILTHLIFGPISEYRKLKTVSCLVNLEMQTMVCYEKHFWLIPWVLCLPLKEPRIFHI